MTAVTPFLWFDDAAEEAVTFYIGLWGGTEGTAWVDDAELHEVGGVNLLRRESCPLRVASADGKTVYVEGCDFEPWADEKLGVEPYAGEFSDDHAAPTIVLTKNSRIKEGDKLLASCWHTVLIYDEQVCCTLVNEELFKHVANQVKAIEGYLKPKRYFMQHDEIRVAGWNAYDAKKDTTAGQLLAENARRCVAAIKGVNPNAGIMVWSDMFDPHHNAKPPPFYLVRGTLEGSWEGLDKETLVINWNSGEPEKVPASSPIEATSRCWRVTTMTRWRASAVGLISLKVQASPA